MTKWIHRIVLLSSILILVSACATNPVTGGRDFARSEAWEASVGPKYHQEIMKQYTVLDDPELQAYVNDIGQKLSAKSHRSDLDFTFTLLDSPQVNAFAIPGGYVYVTRGIMAYMSKEAHLAGVIGHEIGHVTARHGAKRAAQAPLVGIGTAAVAILTGSQELAQLSQMLGGALISGYGRKQELESDRLGAEYIAKNNYDVDDMLGVIGILKNQELFAAEKAKTEGRQPPAYHGLFASHPRNDQRLQEVINAANKFRDTSEPLPDDGKFLRLTDGMTYGESEEQGITRGNKFYHNALNLHLEFPHGWRIMNQPTQLVGVSPDGTKAMVMRMDGQAQGVKADQYLSSKFQGLRDGRSVAVSGGQAYAAVATLSDQNTGQSRNIRVSAITRGDQTFVIMGDGKGVLPNQEFFNLIQSVRGLKTSEQKLAKERKIELITARKGDTFAKLAKRANLDSYSEQQLRLINNMYPKGEPRAGQKIKIIR